MSRHKKAIVAMKSHDLQTVDDEEIKRPKVPRHDRDMKMMLLAFYIVVLATVIRSHFFDPYHPYDEKGPLLTEIWGNSTQLIGKRPYNLHIYSHEVPSARYNVLMIHGTAHHAGRYHKIAPRLSNEKTCNVYGVDLKGHGLSGGARGVFRFKEWIQDVNATVEFIRERNQLPVILLGASQGGELSFHSLHHTAADADISLNILLNAEIPMKPIIKYLQGILGTVLEKIMLKDFVRLPLSLFIDFKAAFDFERDPTMYEERARDPLMVWKYGFASYRSVFTYKPNKPASFNKKPVLVICGENDPLVPASHCQACFSKIGGKHNNLYVIPGGTHQPMFSMMTHFIDTVDDWITKRVLDQSATAAVWSPPALMPSSNTERLPN